MNEWRHGVCNICHERVVEQLVKTSLCRQGIWLYICEKCR